MIRDRRLWEQFERRYVREDRPSFEQKIRILEGLHELVVVLKAWPPKDLLEGLEADIHMARVINSYGRITSEKDTQPTGRCPTPVRSG
ncbi:MAG: hypothetical protein JRH06_10100 [Deltaproteobacteria bacterium]|nr:hypothetical protein [Deltaproteobacteria bacterium]MBW2137896.1 hypothetical protein [Deltaproteobacteria bacterium]